MVFEISYVKAMIYNSSVGGADAPPHSVVLLTMPANATKLGIRRATL
jgi:hypothetical protein